MCARVSVCVYVCASRLCPMVLSRPLLYLYASMSASVCAGCIFNNVITSAVPQRDFFSGTIIKGTIYNTANYITL